MAETLEPRKLIGRKRRLALLLPPILVAFALIGVLYVSEGPDLRQELDSNLCALDQDESDAKAVLLLDFRKSLDDAHRSLLIELIREVSLQLGANTELRVFALSTDSQAPRLLIGRICKPYDNADLQVETAKDQRDGLRDCENLPAQLPASLREAADRFCDHRQSLQLRANALASNQSLTPVANSYLIEALEDTIIDLSEGSGPRAIYVLSDMMQHAKWYSHLDLEWHEWNFEYFEQARTALASRMVKRPPVSDLTVNVYYMPRLGLTEHSRPKRAHQEFWGEYFDGAQLTFHEQPPLPSYAAQSLMDRLTPEELGAMERERIEQERQEAVRLLAEVRREQSELAKEWEKINEERTRMTAALEPQSERKPAAEPPRQQQSPADQQPADPQLEPEVRQVEIGETVAEADSPPQEPQVAEERTLPDAGQDSVVTSGQGVPGSVEPADSSSDDSSAGIGQLALATDQSPETTLPPCDASLLPRFRDAATGIYPGRRRMNYGSSTVTIRFLLDEQGATIDDEIALVPEQSSADRPRSLDIFARTAIAAVKHWAFEFDGEQQDTCSRRQERTTTFKFRYD